MPSVCLLAKNRLEVPFGCSDRLDSEILYKNVKDCRADKCGKRGAEPYVLYSQMEKGQENTYRLLLVPGKDQ